MHGSGFKFVRKCLSLSWCFFTCRIPWKIHLTATIRLFLKVMNMIFLQSVFLYLWAHVVSLHRSVSVRRDPMWAWKRTGNDFRLRINISSNTFLDFLQHSNCCRFLAGKARERPGARQQKIWSTSKMFPKKNFASTLKWVPVYFVTSKTVHFTVFLLLLFKTCHVV